MNKISKIILCILGGIVVFILGARILTPEDTYICKDGQWIKHGNPRAGIPTKNCD